ncbi:MAG: asparagine synthase (glutamine-hydrolyzing) [Phycisphaerales bacterium]|nr:asparagine synthase (glutamine-hydrolyzing) [Phycisphaerales bacterium]
MCGLGVIWQTLPPGVEADGGIADEWLDALDASIALRGSDASGRLRHGAVDPKSGERHLVGMVHRRLAVIDPAGGGQPMTLADPDDPDAPPTLAVVFNGCIYNHRELRAELEENGADFRSDHSDTETLLHGWRAWGEELPARLHGMYAFAVWDPSRPGLFVTRDPFGEKPLFATLWEQDGVLTRAWCTTLPGLVHLRSLAGLESPIDREGVASMVRKGWGADAYADIRQCDTERTSAMGRTLATLKNGDPPEASEPLTLDRLEALLVKAVERRLDADVPLGCFLSGGIDSSLIAAMAQRASGDLSTFCVRMPEAAYDESPFARRVAEHLGTEHETVEVSPDPASDLESLIEQLGLPFADSSLLATHWLSRAVKQRVSVALSGDGGDELFAGYFRYRAADLLAKWGPLLRLLPASLLPARDPKSSPTSARRLFVAAKTGGPAEINTVFDRPTLRAVFPELRDRAPPGPADAEALRATDLVDYLPDDLLRKVDTASMAVSLEVRAPFLDHDLARAAIGTPTHLLTPRGERKGLLRDLARRHLPEEVVDRPKQGFAVPIGSWFRNDFGSMRQLLRDHLLAADPFPGLPFQAERGAIDRLLDEHDAAGEASIVPWKGRDHSQRLYALLVLSIWLKSKAGTPPTLQA